MKKTLVVLLLLFVTFSCNKKQVYKNFENGMESQRWNENDIKTHDFEILEDGITYSFFIEVSHVLGTEMDEFPVVIEIKNPDGTLEKREVVVNFKNSECLGDICDVKFLVKEKIQLMKGDYSVRFYPKSKYGFVPNILGVGLTVEIQE